jgi:hypothetical protein
MTCRRAQIPFLGTSFSCPSDSIPHSPSPRLLSTDTTCRGTVEAGCHDGARPPIAPRHRGTVSAWRAVLFSVHADDDKCSSASSVSLSCPRPTSDGPLPSSYRRLGPRTDRARRPGSSVGQDSLSVVSGLASSPQPGAETKTRTLGMAANKRANNLSCSTPLRCYHGQLAASCVARRRDGLRSTRSARSQIFLDTTPGSTCILHSPSCLGPAALSTQTRRRCLDASRPARSFLVRGLQIFGLPVAMALNGGAGLSGRRWWMRLRRERQTPSPNRATRLERRLARPCLRQAGCGR